MIYAHTGDGESPEKKLSKFDNITLHLSKQKKYFEGKLKSDTDNKHYYQGLIDGLSLAIGLIESPCTPL